MRGIALAILAVWALGFHYTFGGDAKTFGVIVTSVFTGLSLICIVNGW